MENLGLNPNFWAGKRVLLTGHTGFKGSWMSLWLSLLNCEVLGYSLSPDTTPSHFELAEIKRDLTSVIADIRDYSRMEQVVQSFQPEVVIHMAAQPLVRKSYREPLETFDTNVMGTANLLQACRGIEGLQAILIVTSDKCYENQEREAGYKENEPMGGHDPYSASKGCTELVTSAFRDSFFSPALFEQHGVVVASARAGNVFGGGDWCEDRLIPDVIRAIDRGEVLQIRNPSAVRPWQFVLEPLCGYLLLAQQMVEKGVVMGEGWNFGPSTADEVTVSRILAEMKLIFGDALNWEADKGEHPHEANLLRLDTSKSRSKLGWRPRWNLQKGLAETAKWYQAVLSDSKKADSTQARQLSLELLESYITDEQALIEQAAQVANG